MGWTQEQKIIESLLMLIIALVRPILSISPDIKTVSMEAGQFFGRYSCLLDPAAAPRLRIAVQSLLSICG